LLLFLLLLFEGVPLLRLLRLLRLDTVALLWLWLLLLLCDLAAGADELLETVDDDFCDTD
jgi:hypothetical protein